MDFAGYLDAKRALDDRSLHPRVWAEFCRRLTGHANILDIGCGLGATLDRLAPVVGRDVHFTGVDRDETVILMARARHADKPNVSFRAAELTDFARLTDHPGSWPIITAHAFLDLVDLEVALDALSNLLEPDGLVYFTVTFDDLTIIEPTDDPTTNDEIVSAYHQAMYGREWGGSGGNGRAGRQLLHALIGRGFDLVDVGPSDWVIAPVKGRYRDDDRAVLNYLLSHIVEVVRGTGNFSEEALTRWEVQRARQVEATELIYIAHQLDVLAQRTGRL